MVPVSIDVLTACKAHYADIAKTIDLAQQERDEMGRVSKVLAAGWE
jgi:hypothetical protein